MELKIAVNTSNLLGEGPVWSIEERALYWVDIQEKLLQRWIPSKDGIDIWRMPTEIGSFALTHSGGCVVALRTGLAFLDLNNSDITPICDLEMDLPFTRFNDGKCDRQGRFWAGTMDEEYPKQRASLYRLDQDGSCVKIRGNVGISNGLGWSPDNKVFYYTDSTVNTIYAYDFNAEDGKISNERIFFETTGNYSPDGLTVDSDGFVWSAMWNGWKVVRFSPDGKVDKEIALPVQRPTSCTFGGFELSDLYITSARMDLTEEELKKQPDAGSVLVLRTKMKGLPEPKFMDGI